MPILRAWGSNTDLAFQTVKDVRIDQANGEALAHLEIPDALADEADGYLLHPTVLDGCFQMLMGILQGGGTTYLPTGFRSIRLMAEKAPTSLWCHGVVVSQSAREIECDLNLFDETGRVVATICGMQATAGALRGKTRTDKWGDPVKLLALEQIWGPASTLAEPRRMGPWVIFRDTRLDIADQISAQFEAYGAIPHRIVSIGDTYESDGHNVTIRSGNDDDAIRLMAEAGKVDGVFFAHGLDAVAESDDPTGEEAIVTMIAVSKALARAPVVDRPRVYVATRTPSSAMAGIRWLHRRRRRSTALSAWPITNTKARG